LLIRASSEHSTSNETRDPIGSRRTLSGSPCTAFRWHALRILSATTQVHAVCRPVGLNVCNSHGVYISLALLREDIFKFFVNDCWKSGFSVSAFEHNGELGVTIQSLFSCHGHHCFRVHTLPLVTGSQVSICASERRIEFQELSCTVQWLRRLDAPRHTPPRLPCRHLGTTDQGLALALGRISFSGVHAGWQIELNACVGHFSGLMSSRNS
jgi:hypothetical protein